MSLVPEFELGLWNAWIFILPLLVVRAVIGPKIAGERAFGKVLGPMKKEEIPFIICLSIVFASYAYTIFLPLKLGTVWFPAGLFIYLLGMIVVILALLSFHTTPMDKPVTKGVYRISRNPQYIGDFFINMSISIACLSWIFLLVTIAAVIFEHHMVVSEETACLKRYGEEYGEYMNRTPRWIGIPKAARARYKRKCVIQ